jgi:hypothetical protein
MHNNLLFLLLRVHFSALLGHPLGGHYHTENITALGTTLYFLLRREENLKECAVFLKTEEGGFFKILIPVYDITSYKT